MSSNTDNFNLNKPEATEFYDVEVFNSNFDIIDDQMKKNEARDCIKIESPVIKAGDDVVKNLLVWNKDQNYYEKGKDGMPYDGANIIQLGKFYSTGSFSVGDIGYRLYRQDDGTISTTSRTPDYYIGWVYDENTAYIGVEGGEDKDSIAVPSKLVHELVLDQDAMYIEVDGLDINADGGMYEFWLSGTCSSAVSLLMHVNTDLSDTNYYSQYVKVVNSSISGARYNSPTFGVMHSEQATIIGRIIINPVSGNFVCDTDCIYRGGSNLEARMYKIISVNTFANITKLRFKNLYNYKAGTTLKIFKR